MKKILVINGHPSKTSFNAALMDSYVRGAEERDVEIRRIHVTDLPLEDSLRCCGTETISNGIKNAQEDILWANHIVFFHPVWWSSFPAIMKCFIDLVFIPGFAYKYSPKNPIPKKLLVGRTAHIVLTLNTPVWIYRFVFCSPSVRQLKSRILSFCGIKTTRITYIGPIIDSTEDVRKAFLERLYVLGKKLS